MKDNTRDLLQKLYRGYYYKEVEKIEAPKRFDEREFGYSPFKSGMIRHLSFKSAGDLRALIVKEAPRSVYYSVSFYYEPALPMHLKGWNGGELAFDIDCDDLESSCKFDHDFWVCRQCGYSGKGERPKRCVKCKGDKMDQVNWVCDLCIGKARDEVFKLLDILEKDFGLSRGDMQVFFSGNMGYHVTVTSSEVLLLDQPARSELADYASGASLTSEGLGVVKGTKYDDLVISFPRTGELGWRGKIAEGFAESLGCGEEDDVRVKVAEKYGLERGRWFKKELKEVVKKKGVAIDVAVTTDIHRIFRLPNTLHGETGLLKVECVTLDSFEPFVEAVAFGDEPCKVDVKRAPAITLMGQTFGPFKEEKVILPLYASIYFMARGLAEVCEDG